MKKLLFLLQYADLGSSTKYRVLIYKNLLEKDYNVRYSYFWPNKYVAKYMLNKKKYAIIIILKYIMSLIKRMFILLFIAPKYDVIFIQRCLYPLVKPFFLKRLARKKIRIIFDIDDALHLDNKYHCDSIATIASCVISGSRELYNHYKTFSNTVMIPTIDNNELYTSFIKDTFENKCIGWIGSHSTINNLEVLVEPLNKLIDKYPNVKVKVIADGSYGFEKLIKNFSFAKWDKDTYINEMAEFSVGVMPLKDTSFNSGKCGFKLIQYMDLCKPVVASNVGINKEIVSNYGYIAENNNDWFICLEQMLNNKSVYDNLVENIRTSFLNNYGFKENYKKIKRIIEEN